MKKSSFGNSEKTGFVNVDVEMSGPTVMAYVQNAGKKWARGGAMTIVELRAVCEAATNEVTLQRGPRRLAFDSVFGPATVAKLLEVARAAKDAIAQSDRYYRFQEEYRGPFFHYELRAALDRLEGRDET